MNTRLNNKGFASWELILVAVVLGVIGFAGYHVYSSNHKTSSAAISAANDPVAVPAAPTINSPADLSKTEAVLSQANPSNSNAQDMNQLKAFTGQ